MKMDLYIDDSTKCARCRYTKECTEKAKLQEVSTEIQKIAEKYKDSFKATSAMIDFTCKSYSSRGTGYDGDRETDGVC